MEEQDIIYNPSWFQQDASSGFNDFADAVINSASNQPTSESATSQTAPEDKTEEYDSLFEKMQSMLSELQAAKVQDQEINSYTQQEDDFATYEALFNDDNTPIDWSVISDIKEQKYNVPKNDVAKTIYQEVLNQTGSQKKAENAVKIAEHESGFNPTITNKYNMLGLYQFSPPNQRKYGITKNSSIQEQTKAWLQYQQDNNIPIGQEGVGQLAPAYVGKDVIYKKGSKAYEANKSLDKNKDGIMTSQEINNWYKL